MDAHRRGQMLAALASMPSPVSGADLAGHLGVTTRSVRAYVKEINQNAGHELITTSHRGYRLTPSGLAEAHQPTSPEPLREDPSTPEGRLAHIYRRLLLTAGPISIHELAARLSVSESTIEVTLTKAREQLRDSGLALVRDHEHVSLEGSERLKRRFMRQLLVSSARGLNPRVLKNFSLEYPTFNLSELRTGLQQALSDVDLTVNEYVLTDLVMHVTVAADRVQQGHTIGGLGEEPAAAGDPTRDKLIPLLSRTVEDSLGVRLGPGELELVYRLITVRTAPCGADTGRLVDPHILAMTKEIVADVADHFLLGVEDDRALVNLALHVQNLIHRARAGQNLANPLGGGFKNSHPLVHELALYFSRQVESRTGITIGSGEVDFLAFHLGSQFLRSLDKHQPVSVALVVPQYNQMQELVAERLASALEGQAEISEIITSLDHDWSAVDCDLIVSIVDLAGQTQADVVQISPFAYQSDIDKVVDAVRRERIRLARQRVRATIAALIDPALFHHVERVGSQEEALRLMSEQLVAHGYVDPHFVEDVLDRERRSSTAFGGNFAIPHSMFMDANHTAISILMCDEGIPWGASTVRLVALFALSPDSRHLFRDVLDEFIVVLNEPLNVQRLLNTAGNYDGFVAALEEVLEATLR